THFANVARDGYRSEAKPPLSVAFFPGHPLAARAVTWATGWPVTASLLVAANVALVAALALLSAYLRTRAATDPPGARATTLLLFGLWPAGFFFRMGYSESLLAALVALVMLGTARRWPAWVLAAAAGAATGVRAVGVAASAAVFVHVLLDPTRGPIGRRVLTAVAVAPLAGWGQLAFAAYQYAEFGTPFAVADAHRHWFHYTPEPGDLGPKWVRLLLAEPIWNAYVPDSPRYWADIDQHGNPFLGLAFWNPLLFVGAAVAVGGGWYRRHLTAPEGVLGLGLLLVPYLSRADEMSMVSHARFAAVVLPAHVILGRALAGARGAVRWGTFAAMATLLALWTALFALAWPLF
ncbi:MAG: hypothetical protein J0I06_07140, partial [Planctomycetes bacterium]|nr:hypothetical protein [Planctomycetota bacterium]